ncbi:inactive serine/threonine-protein kinase PLK5 [Ochotona princeps]|uniref:inactive serine/threonine-protein kinase PLK5 n=1 Tax=Ochotona princeps TaxID=9978 RepID=UPI0027149E6C|nr:inactive serine/threonine-protein kinase PLK5 [Ochotona princeps]
MEPGPRRRRRGSHQVVAAFLRDPGSGRVYKRGKLIGKGAFSRCYKLTDMSTSTVFALKVVPRRGSGAGQLRPLGKVEREIALHSSLRHRHIVALHGHFADSDYVYLVLEYCSRQSLAHVLRARQTLTEPEVRYYLRGLVSGLRYLHRRRIVHRDLKLSEHQGRGPGGPEDRCCDPSPHLTPPPTPTGNFFLNKNMVVKIGDLGLAAKLGPGGRCRRVLCGTPNFLAPEVIARNGHSCQSDVWALGCIMYTVLTGTPPFMAAPLSEMYQNIQAARYPEPSHLSPTARRLISRLLAPDPAERPSLDLLLQDDFFTQGFSPDRLPARCCHSPPIFACPQPLGGLLRKVGRLLLPQCGPPCPFTSEDGLDPDSMEWGSQVRNQCPWPLPSPFLHAGSPDSALLDPSLLGPLVLVRKLVPAPQEPPGEQRLLLWAPLWADDSSKYGFGYWLSDGASAVLFRDGTHLALRPSIGRVCYVPHRGQLEMFALRDVPSPLGAKLAVLRLFTCTMQRRLWEQGNLPATSPAPEPGLCLLSFFASQQALLLLFSDGTVQVSFGGGQAHMVLSGQGEGLWLTRWEQGPPGACYSLDSLRRHGCTPATRQQLCHALHLLQSTQGS